MNFTSRIAQIKARKQILEEIISSKKEELHAQEEERESAIEAKVILQTAAKNTQRNVEIHFSDLVTKALHIVFDQPYIFTPEFIERRNKTECDFWFVKDGEKLRPKFTVGGGVIDIASFALRLSYWKLENSSPVFVFDEPFKNLSSKLIPKAAEMLRFISNEFNLQMIIVTHRPEIVEQADRVFEIENGTVIS